MKVSALTVNGSGPSTGWLYASTFESDLDETVVPNPPSTLRAKAEDDSITIAWNPPSSKNILVRGYTIGWGKGIPDEYTKVVDNKQRYFVIEDLSKCLPSSLVHLFVMQPSSMTLPPPTLDPRPCFPTSRPPSPNCSCRQIYYNSVSRQIHHLSKTNLPTNRHRFALRPPHHSQLSSCPKLYIA